MLKKATEGFKAKVLSILLIVIPILSIGAIYFLGGKKLFGYCLIFLVFGILIGLLLKLYISKTKQINVSSEARISPIYFLTIILVYMIYDLIVSKYNITGVLNILVLYFLILIHGLIFNVVVYIFVYDKNGDDKNVFSSKQLLNFCALFCLLIYSLIYKISDLTETILIIILGFFISLKFLTSFNKSKLNENSKKLMEVIKKMTLEDLFVILVIISYIIFSFFSYNLLLLLLMFLLGCVISLFWNKTIKVVKNK